MAYEIPFDSLPPIDCPLMVQPTENMCIGDLVKLLTYNTMVLERYVLDRTAPAGMVQHFAGQLGHIPEGFLLCDGSQYSSSVYPRLYKALGNLHGFKTLSAHCFRLPDLLKTVIVGVDAKYKNDQTRPYKIDNYNNWKYNAYAPSAGTVYAVEGTNNRGDSGSWHNGAIVSPTNYTDVNRYRSVMLIPVISHGGTC